MKKEHRGLTFNEILFSENIDKKYSELIRQRKIDEAVKLLVEIGYDDKEAKAQVRENDENGSLILNFIKAIFHGLTDYRFQK